MRDALSRDAERELDSLGAAPGVDTEGRLAALQSLAQLDDEQQALAIMLFVDGMSQGEAAAELGLSRVTVNKRTQRMRAQLGLSALETEEASS